MDSYFTKISFLIQYNIYRNLLLKVGLLIALCLINFNLKAWSGDRGEVYAESLGNNKFKIIVQLYRDCRGAPWSANKFPIEIRSKGKLVIDSVIRVKIENVPLKCDRYNYLSCFPSNTGNTGDGFEMHVYETIVDFNNSQHSIFLNPDYCKISISMKECCLPGGLGNISGGNALFFLEMNLCYDWHFGEATPKFSPTHDLFYVCNNEPAFLNGRAFGNYEDSIVHEKSNRYRDVFDTIANKYIAIQYLSPYTTDIPLDVYCPNGNCTPRPNLQPPAGYYYDAKTGDLIFTPINGPTRNSITLKASQFKKDSSNIPVWTSSVYRQSAIMVNNCSDNKPPSYRNLDRIVNKKVCLGDTVSFDFAIEDILDTYQDLPDTLTYTYTHTLPGNPSIILLNDSLPNLKFLRFFWVVPSDVVHLSNFTTFTLKVSDNRCLIPSTSNRTFSFSIYRKPILEIITDTLSCGWLKFSFESKLKDHTFSRFNPNWQITNSVDSFFVFNSTNFFDSFPIPDKGLINLRLFTTHKDFDCENLTDTSLNFVGQPAFFAKISGPKIKEVCIDDSLSFTCNIKNETTPLYYKWIYNNDTLTFQTKNIQFSPQVSGILRVLVQNPKGCISLDTVNINIIEKPIVSIIEKNLTGCNGSIFNLKVNHPNVLKAKFWENSDTSSQRNINQSGNYIFTVVSMKNCIGKDTAIVNILPLGTIKNLEPKTCQGSPLTLQGFSVAAYDSAEWKWGPVSNPDGFDSLYTRTYTSNLIIPHQFRYKLNGIWCSQSHNFFVVALPKPQPNFVLSDTALCLRNNLFTATDISPAAVSRSWINPDAGTASDSVYRFSLQNHGAFSLGLALVNAQGCADTLYKPLRTLPNPVAFASVLQQRPCLADNFVEVDFGASIATGSISSRSILWGNGKSNSISPASQIYGAAGTYNAMVIANSNRGCTDTLALPLQVLPAPTPTLSLIKACENDSLVLFSSNPHNQENKHFLYLNQVLLDSANLAANQSQTWNSTIATAPVQAKLVAISSQGCADSISLSISPNPSPRASIQAVLLRDQKLAYRFTGSGTGSIAQWQWFSSQGNSGNGQVWEPNFSDTGMTTITLRVTSPQGCSSDTSIVVPVYDKITLFVPNAFSPNADGINDTWKVGGMLLFQDFSIRVYNRWGQQVWQATKATDEWNGEGAINGAYLYILTARDILGQLHELQGMLYLER